MNRIRDIDPMLWVAGYWIVLILAMALLGSVSPARAATPASTGPLGALELDYGSRVPVKGPMDALGRFIQSQQAILGISVSPLDVMDMRAEGISLLRGPAYGEHGLSLYPGRHKEGAKAYIEIDYGGRFKLGEKAALRIMLGLHPANITNLILTDVIKSDRLRIPALPENFVGGPMFRIPLPGDPESWTWKNGFRLVFAYLFE